MGQEISNIKIVVGGLIVKGEEMVVVVKEGEADIAGLWNLPVGGLEANEKIADGAAREIKEETGLDVTLEALIGVYQNPRRPDGQNTIKFIFLARVAGGTLRWPTGEIQEAKWLAITDAYKISKAQLRDETFRQVIDDYRSGKRYPLDIIKLHGGAW